MPHRGMRLAAELIGWWAPLFLIYLVFISTLSPLELFVGAAVSALAAVGACAIHRAVRPEVGPAAHWIAAAWAWPGTLVTETVQLARVVDVDPKPGAATVLTVHALFDSCSCLESVLTEADET